MLLLIDVDALCKLAHWRLLAELPALTGVSWHDCATLSSAKHRARRAVDKPDGKTFRDVAAAQEAVAAIGHMQSTLDVNPQALGPFEDAPGIDPGEAVLLSALAAHSNARLLTGDKRALRALAALDASITQAYANRIVIVEHVILAALDERGLTWLRERVCPWKDIDKAVGVIMGSRCDLQEAAVREGIASYIDEMAELCDPSILANGLRNAT